MASGESARAPSGAHREGRCRSGGPGRERRLELVRAGAQSWREMLDDLLRLHAARWRTRGEAGVVADPRVKRFHREAAGALLDAGLLRLYGLRLDGRTAGVLHVMTAAGRACAYLHGIDPAAARHGPGNLLFRHAAEEAIAEGALELDLLRGQEPYKRRWGAQDRPTHRLVLAAHGA